MKMKREGAVGLILIAILVVVMLVFLRGKSLEDIMGSGYTQADVTEITATLTGADETLTTDFAAGDQGYLDLISLLQEPSYSRTFTSDDSGALDYAVTLTFTGSGDQTWECMPSRAASSSTPGSRAAPRPIKFLAAKTASRKYWTSC